MTTGLLLCVAVHAAARCTFQELEQQLPNAVAAQVLPVPVYSADCLLACLELEQHNLIAAPVYGAVPSDSTSMHVLLVPSPPNCSIWACVMPTFSYCCPNLLKGRGSHVTYSEQGTTCTRV